MIYGIMVWIPRTLDPDLGSRLAYFQNLTGISFPMIHYTKIFI